jgi:predicted phosphodiesterase
MVWLWMMLLCLLVGRSGGQIATRTSTQPTAQSAAPAAQGPTFRFAVIADPHIEKVQTLENLRRFLYTIGDGKIDFLVILGDICSYMPDLLEQTAGVLRSGPLKVYTIPGNKDNDYGKAPEWYRAALGESCYAFDHKGWRFLMHDSFNPPPADWLKAQLATPEPGMPIIFCTHAPPGAKDRLGIGLWADLSRAANVKVALTGHRHARETGSVGRVTYEVFKDCFLRGTQNPGTYYILDVLPSGKVDIHEHSVADLRLREPPDAVPTVTITAPHGGQVLRGTTVLAGSANDDKGVRRVEYSVGWGPWQPAQGCSSWQAQLDTSSLGDGHHLLRVRALDSADQVSLQLPRVIVTTENHLAAGRIFRFQQGRNGYAGCSDATVKRFSKVVNRTAGHPSDLQCWTWGRGETEFNEFYIRFDLSKSSIPADAKIRRVSLTLHSPWQHSIDLAGRLCGYFVGLLEEGFKANMTFASRPARPGWLGEPQPEPVLKGTWPRLAWWYMNTLPQPVVVDLTPIRGTVQQWLREPANNHGLVFSPAAGQNYNMSARGSRYPDVRFRPMLEIEIEQSQETE